MPPTDPKPPLITLEDARARLESEFELNQSNVLPLDVARNEGRFYGSMIRGNRALNPAQRIGFFLMGFLACGQAFFAVLGAFPQLAKAAGMRVFPTDNQAISYAYLAFSALILFIGVKLIVKAFTPNKQARIADQCSVRSPN